MKFSLMMSKLNGVK